MIFVFLFLFFGPIRSYLKMVKQFLRDFHYKFPENPDLSYFEILIIMEVLLMVAWQGFDHPYHESTWFFVSL